MSIRESKPEAWTSICYGVRSCDSVFSAVKSDYILQLGEFYSVFSCIRFIRVKLLTRTSVWSNKQDCALAVYPWWCAIDRQYNQEADRAWGLVAWQIIAPDIIYKLIRFDIVLSLIGGIGDPSRTITFTLSYFCIPTTKFILLVVLVVGHNKIIVSFIDICIAVHIGPVVGYAHNRIIRLCNIHIPGVSFYWNALL